MNIKPEFIKGEIVRNIYDGVADDILTAGLGASGLAKAPIQPETADAQSLRRLAIHSNYRGLLDTTPQGGFGVLYGPNVAPDGSATQSEGMIGGKEYLAFSDDGAGDRNVGLMVQIPDNFDPKNPCVVAAPSSGSRGVYAALPLVGEWALKRGFAVAYTDKGTGMFAHDIDRDTISLMAGERTDAGKAGNRSAFTAKIPSGKNPPPHRIATKHAHGGQNPEADWGRHVLQSIRFAFYVLNLEENFGKKLDDGTVVETLTPENTVVIASGISNGGGASIRAAEQDTDGLIDGVAVSEPNVSSESATAAAIRQGDKKWDYPGHGRNLLDVMTLLNIYQPCANLASESRGSAPLNHLDETLCENRCLALKERGLLSGDSIEEMAENAQKTINDYGILEDQNLIQPSHFANFVVEGICVTYANAYGKFGVADNLCGYSFACVDPETKKPAPWPEYQADRSFGNGTGVPPTAGVELINDRSKEGPALNRESVSLSGAKDMNLEGALCLRRLAVGKDERGGSLLPDEREKSERILDGISKARATGNLKGIPTVIVHGRNDAILPPNHTSRSYFALNSLKEKEGSNLRYYEVTNAHHLDSFNAFPGFDSRYVPLHRYLIQALTLVYEHIVRKRPLPPSQVVRTTPRGIDGDGKVPPIARKNVPPIADAPDGKDLIRLAEGNLFVPD